MAYKDMPFVVVAEACGQAFARQEGKMGRVGRSEGIRAMEEAYQLLQGVERARRVLGTDAQMFDEQQINKMGEKIGRLLKDYFASKECDHCGKETT